MIKCDQPGVVLFKVEGLQCQVILNPSHMQALHLKVTQIPMSMPMPDGKQPYQWSVDDLQIIEQFFELRVAAPPYRPNSLCGFAKMLNVPPQVLKDFIQVTFVLIFFLILIFFFLSCADYSIRVNA